MAWTILCGAIGLPLWASGQPRVIADFDNRTDLSVLRGNNALLEWVSPAPEGMKGNGAVRVTLKPGGSYPGFQTAATFPGDWGGYGKLCIDFFNPSETSIKINVRIDDARSAGYSTRYNLEDWGMRPGPSTLTLEFPRLQIEDRSRLIDVSKIKAVYFFSPPAKQPVEYYIGSIRLEPAPRAAEPLPEGLRAFDFGSDGSPLWPGFVKVTPSMAFDEERGFGFLTSVPLSAQDLGVPDPLARDAVSGSVWRPYEYGFAVKVQPGRYGVQAIARHIGPDRLPTRSGSITAEGAEVFGRNIPKEVFYSDEILYRGLSRPYRLDQDAYAKFFSPDLDWHRFEVEVSDGRLNLIFENLAVFALAVYPIDQKDSAEKRLAEIDRSRREFFGEKVYYEEKRSPESVSPTPEEQAAGMLAWTVPYWEGIAPWSRPSNRTGEPAARIAVARGEYEPITVAVAPLRDLDLGVRIEEAKGPEGAILPANCFEVRLVQYRETRRSEGIYTPKESFMTSVRGPVALQSALAQRVWITLHVPDDASPGVYRGAIVLQSQGASPLRIPMEVEVLPLTLPDSSEALFAWYYRDPGQLNYFFNFFDPGLKPGQLEREMRDLKAHGCNSLEFPAPAIKSISAQGDVEFDFSTWDLYAETAWRVGMGLEHPPQTFIIELANSLGKKGIKEGTEPFALAYRSAVLKLEEWSRRERLPLVFWVVDEPREKLKNSWNRNLAETLFLLKALDGIEGLRTTVTPMADAESGVDYGPSGGCGGHSSDASLVQLEAADAARPRAGRSSLELQRRGGPAQLRVSSLGGGASGALSVALRVLASALRYLRGRLGSDFPLARGALAYARVRTHTRGNRRLAVAELAGSPLRRFAPKPIFDQGARAIGLDSERRAALSRRRAGDRAGRGQGLRGRLERPDGRVAQAGAGSDYGGSEGGGEGVKPSASLQRRLRHSKPPMAFVLPSRASGSGDAPPFYGGTEPDDRMNPGNANLLIGKRQYPISNAQYPMSKSRPGCRN
jgi:hypothetical protein